MKSSNKSAPGDFVEMGSIGRPHGLLGEVGARWEGEAPVPVRGKIWLQTVGEDPRPFEVEAARVHKGNPLISLAGIDDRDKAEALRGARIFIPRSELPPPGEDEAWLEDLIGADILLEDGKRIGVLDHIEYPAGQEIWAIKDEAGREILFPARPEFIASIDVDAGEVRIAPPPGLLDIYLA